MNTLIALLYLSTARDTLTDQDLSDILKVSRIKNQQADISGILCSGGGHFIQVLEGPQREVLKSYLRILDDPRHKECLLVGITPLKDRIFTGWSMGYINVSSAQMLQRRELLMNTWQNQSKGTNLINIMQSLIKG